MKGMLALFVSALMLFACADGVSSGSKEEDKVSSVSGWRSAGFTPVISSTRGGGLQKITHSGNWLLLMDTWTSPVEGKSGTSTYSPRLFISKIGSGVWDTLVPPSSAYVKRLYADSYGVYVGTYNSEVFEYNPDKKDWKNINVKNADDSLWYHIYGIQRIDGKLIVSMAGHSDSLGNYAKILLQDESGWKELQVPRIRKDMYTESQTDPLYFVEAAEMDGSLYVSSADGVWKLDVATLSWTELPKFPKMKWNSNYKDVYEVQDLVVYKGKLIAVDGTNDRVYQWDGANEWLALDSVITPAVANAYGDTSYNVYNSSLYEIRDLTTDGGHLFVSGDASCPKVYMGDYGKPYGDIPKGWRMMRLGWCGDKGCVSNDVTRSIDVVGDTIYAAAWEGLYKMPLSELDSAIVGQSDFKGFEKYQ